MPCAAARPCANSAAEHPDEPFRQRPHERLKTAKKRTASSARWLSRQINDPYVKQAKAEGWRSRAASS
jgi:hypothetical protein